jgi:two-component system nitrate/nitrite response regulator NarL
MSSQLIAGALKRCRNNFDVHALTGNSSWTFQELPDYRPDVAVISAHLEDGQFKGFKVVQQLHASESKTSAVILVDGDERDLVVGAFRSGARGVFCRGDSFRALPKCIRCVHEGQIWASNTELEFLLEVITKLKPMQVHNTGGMALLTRREQEVVRLIADGMRNQEISRKLNLREHTVRNYVFRIFEKLGISSRVELVLYALSGPEWDQAPQGPSAGPNHNP